MILFRCNADSDVGFGHLVRCRALAIALGDQGQRCAMVGPQQRFAGDQDHRIFDSWYPLAFVDEPTDATRLIELAGEVRASALMLDDYRVGECYQRTLHATGIRWGQFQQDYDQPVLADFIMNPSPVAQASRYRHVENADASLLLGPRYALLRSMFQGVQPREPDRPVRKVLLIFGGGDDRGGVQRCLSALLDRTDSQIEFLVVSGRHNPRNEFISRWIEDHGQDRVALCIDPASVADRFVECDLAITTAGSSIYELAACGVPMLVTSVAENQTRHAAAWADHRAVVDLGPLANLSNNRLCEEVNRMITDTRVRCQLAHRATALCDAHGADRVATALIELAHAT